MVDMELRSAYPRASFKSFSDLTVKHAGTERAFGGRGRRERLDSGLTFKVRR